MQARVRKLLGPALVFIVSLVLINIPAAIFIAVSYSILDSHLKKTGIKKLNRLVAAQFNESLRFISSSLSSGLSLYQSIDSSVEELPMPLSKIFKEVISNHRLGKSFEASFLELSAQYDNKDMELFATVISISKETGGNISGSISKITEAAAERDKLRAKIDATTAQGRLSGLVIGGLPVLLLILFYLIDPLLIDPLFTTLAGWLILSLAAGLETAGMYLINKITDIEV